MLCCYCTCTVELFSWRTLVEKQATDKADGGEGPLFYKHLPASHCVKQMSRTIMTMNSSRRYLASFVFGKVLSKGLALTDSRLNSTAVHTVLQVQFCRPCDTLIFPYQDWLFVTVMTGCTVIYLFKRGNQLTAHVIIVF